MTRQSNNCVDESQISKTVFASWLANELAPTLCGNKPATILSLSDTKSHKWYSCWTEFGEDIFKGSIVRFMVLVQRPDRATILFYRHDRLAHCIEAEDSKNVFLRLGYPVDAGLEQCLTVLKDRFQRGCPHEIGVFLGIPLKDVLGFMGFSDEPLTCRNHWCIFGDPQQSLETIQKFTDDRLLISGLLQQGFCPLKVLVGAAAA